MSSFGYDHDADKNSHYCDQCGNYHQGNCPPVHSRACQVKDHAFCKYAWCECDCHDDGGAAQ
jgi:hypothetical protein